MSEPKLIIGKRLSGCIMIIIPIFIIIFIVALCSDGNKKNKKIDINPQALTDFIYQNIDTTEAKIDTIMVAFTDTGCELSVAIPQYLGVHADVIGKIICESAATYLHNNGYKVGGFDHIIMTRLFSPGYSDGGLNPKYAFYWGYATYRHPEIVWKWTKENV